MVVKMVARFIANLIEEARCHCAAAKYSSERTGRCPILCGDDQVGVNARRRPWRGSRDKAISPCPCQGGSRSKGSRRHAHRALAANRRYARRLVFLDDRQRVAQLLKPLAPPQERRLNQVGPIAAAPHLRLVWPQWKGAGTIVQRQRTHCQTLSP